jgi:YD repeat-containing protein
MRIGQRMMRRASELGAIAVVFSGEVLMGAGPVLVNTPGPAPANPAVSPDGTGTGGTGCMSFPPTGDGSSPLDGGAGGSGRCAGGGGSDRWFAGLLDLAAGGMDVSDMHSGDSSGCGDMLEGEVQTFGSGRTVGWREGSTSSNSQTDSCGRLANNAREGILNGAPSPVRPYIRWSTSSASDGSEKARSIEPMEWPDHADVVIGKGKTIRFVTTGDSTGPVSAGWSSNNFTGERTWYGRAVNGAAGAIRYTETRTFQTIQCTGGGSAEERTVLAQWIVSITLVDAAGNYAKWSGSASPALCSEVLPPTEPPTTRFTGIVSPNGGEMRWIDEYENNVIVGYRIEIPNGQIWRYRFDNEGRLQSRARVHSPTLQETGHVFTYKYYEKRDDRSSDPWCGRVKWVIESVPTDDRDGGQIRVIKRARYFRYVDDNRGELCLMMDAEGVRRFSEVERLKNQNVSDYESAIQVAPTSVLEPYARFSIRSAYSGGVFASGIDRGDSGGTPTPPLIPIVPSQLRPHEIVIGGNGCGSCGTGSYKLYYFGVYDDGLPYYLAAGADPLSHAEVGVMVVDPPSSPSDIRRVYRLSTYDRWGHLASRLVIVNHGQSELLFEPPPEVVPEPGMDVIPPTIDSNSPDVQIFAERYIRDKGGKLIEIHQSDSYPKGGNEPSVVVGPVVPNGEVFPRIGQIALKWNPSPTGMVRKILHRPNVTSMNAIDADDAGFPVAEFVQKGPGNPFGLEEVDDPTQGLISTPRASWLSGAKFVSWRRWGFPLAYQFDNAPTTAVRRAMVTEVRSMDREIEFAGGSGLAVEYAAVESAVALNVPGVRSTSYAYQQHSGTNARPTAGLQLMARTVREQGASAADNGPDPEVIIETKTVYRLDGSVAFQVHPEGRIDYTQSRFGMPKLRVEDWTGGGLSVSEGQLLGSDWVLATAAGMSMPTVVGINAITRWAYANDADGDWRLRSRTSPDGRQTWIHRSVMKDGRRVDFTFPRREVVRGVVRGYGPVNWEVKTLSGRTEVSGTLGLPPEGVSLDPQHGPLVKISADDPLIPYDPLSALRDNLLPGGRSHVANLTVTTFDESATRVLSQRAYPVVPSAAAQQWWASVASESEESNFLYDSVGRMVGSRTPARTITRLLLDPLGRARSRWVGTNDYGAAEFPQQFVQGSGTAASNLVRVEAYEYDGGGVGVGRLTASVQFAGGAETGRRTEWLFDWMGRPIVQRGPQSPHTVSKYDWAGRVVATASVVGDGANLTDETDPAATTFSDRRSLVENSYDARGQLWKTVQRAVDALSGSLVSGPEGQLETLTWFDESGRVIKRLGSEHVKYEYDRLGRVINEYTLAKDDDAGQYAAAKGVVGDTLLQQTRTVYDNANKSGVVLGTITVDRLPESTVTGALLTEGTGLSGSVPLVVEANQINGWPQIRANWFDALNRVVTSVDYGTWGLAGEEVQATHWERFQSAPARDTPPSPVKLMRNDTEYDAVGRVAAVIDQADRRHETTFDALGRVVAETSNKTNDNNSTTLARDSNVVTRYQYSAGRMVAMWVDQQGNDVNNDPNNPYGVPPTQTGPNPPVEDQYDQVTRYLYGIPESTPVTSTIASNDLLYGVVYPEQTESLEQARDVRTQWFGYNSLGEFAEMLDQNGTRIKVRRDRLGREIGRDVVALNPIGATATLDDRVRSIDTDYDLLGRAAGVRQYDAVPGGSGRTLLDTVEYSYDSWGALEAIVQNGLPSVPNNVAASRVQFTGGVPGGVPIPGERRAYRRTGQLVQVHSGTSSTGWDTKLDVGYDFGSAALGSVADTGRVVGVRVNGAEAVRYRGYIGPDRLATATLRAQRPTQNGPQTFDVATRTLVAIGGAQPGGPTGYLDRFGRVLIDRWARSDGSESASPYFENGLSYTPEGNLAGVTDATWAEQSALFKHDGLDRLTHAQHGPIVELEDEQYVAATRDEEWKPLSQTGNWLNRQLKLNTAANTLTEQSTYTRANEWATRTLAVTPAPTSPLPSPLRISALDGRATVAAAALATFLGGFAALGAAGQLSLLIGLPLGVVWFLRTTLTHAIAFEDAIRRIEEIEQRVNALAGQELLGFQTHHPSRGKAVGGRTGTQTILAVVVTSLMLLAACLYLVGSLELPPAAPVWIFALYDGAVGLYVLTLAVTYRRYRFVRRPTLAVIGSGLPASAHETPRDPDR